jgi:hypothetical protein
VNEISLSIMVHDEYFLRKDRLQPKAMKQKAAAKYRSLMFECTSPSGKQKPYHIFHAKNSVKSKNVQSEKEMATWRIELQSQQLR